jgi:agmatine deiminase
MTGATGWLDSTPAADGLTMPPEWARHERCVMAWPCRVSVWGTHLDAAKREYAAVARAVAAFEPVLLVARPGDGDEARRATDGAAIEVVEWPLDDSWTRDVGAIVVTDRARGDRRAGVRFRFNAWGEKFDPYAHDAEFAARMCEWVGIDGYDARPFVLEGGSITVDGAGTLITTEQCLLDPNRNPDLSRRVIEERLRSWLGVERIVWLPFGLVEDWDTDGHVDNVAAFVAPNTVVAQRTTDVDNPNYERLRRNVEVLHEAGLHVRELDVLPYATIDEGATSVVVPPTNFYQANGALIVPVVADSEDAARALAALRAAVPDREVVGVPGVELAYGGGGVHCITQQVPGRTIA